MENRANFGPNCLDGTNLDKTYLIFKESKAPGKTDTIYVPINDILEKYDISKSADLVGVRLPYSEEYGEDAASDKYSGKTDFILKWYRLSNLLWQINGLLDASIVNDKQRKALSNLITAEFFRMRENYENSLNY